MILTCTICGSQYATTPEENTQSLEDAKKQFGPIFEDSIMDPVCGSCYAIAMAHLTPEILEKSKQNHLKDKSN